MMASIGLWHQEEEIAASPIAASAKRGEAENIEKEAHHQRNEGEFAARRALTK